MIGQNLKKIRESKGMSQEYVAKALNVSRQSISKWENDRAYPDIENLILLSQLYKIPIDTLLDNAVSTAESVEKIEDDQVGENFITVSMLSILLIASSFVSVIGIIVSAIFFVRTRKKSYPRYFYILCILCFFFCVFNFGVMLNSMFFHSGIVTIQ